MTEAKIPLTNLSSLQLDKVLLKLQLTAPEGYDEDGKIELLRCSKIFNRGIGEYEDKDIIAIFSKRGNFVDFESSDGSIKAIFAKSESGKVMYPCSVCTKDVTDKSDSTGLGLVCDGCGWFFHAKCTDKPMSLELFNALKDSPSYVKVLCPPCNSVYGSALSKMKKIEKKVDSLGSSISSLEKTITQGSRKPLYSETVTGSNRGKLPRLPPDVLNGLKSLTKANTEEENANKLKRTRIVIRPEDTGIRTSKDIRRAFNRHYQGVIIKHCRLSAAGSIVFEFENEDTAKTVQENWSLEYFGCNKGMKIPGDFNTVGMIKYVYDDYSEDEMKKEILKNYSGIITKCDFQKKRSDNSFNGMIKIEVSSRDNLLKLISERIKFCNQRYIVEEFQRKSRVVKCNKCQGWGHIQRYCKKEPKCGKCADKHETRTCTITSQFKCAHCSLNHMAGSQDCKVFKEKVAIFTSNSP